MTDDFGDPDFGGDGPRILPADCTHYCEGGHFDGDDMTMVDIERLWWQEKYEILRSLVGAARNHMRQWEDLPDDRSLVWTECRKMMEQILDSVPYSAPRTGGDAR